MDIWNKKIKFPAWTSGSYRMLPPMLIELLLRLAREGAFRTRVGSLAAVIHLAKESML
jgi:uncharacterized membrane protein